MGNNYTDIQEANYIDSFVKDPMIWNILRYLF